jgi:hypothetical protein
MTMKYVIIFTVSKNLPKIYKDERICEYVSAVITFSSSISMIIVKRISIAIIRIIIVIIIIIVVTILLCIKESLACLTYFSVLRR